MNNEFEIGESELKQWNDLTLRQYIELIDVIENQNLTLLDKQLKVVGIVDGKSESDFNSLKYGDFVKLAAERTQFLKKMPRVKPVDEIQVGGHRFKFVHQITELTAGQFIDINQSRGNVNELNRAAAVFFLPIKGKRVLKYGEIPFETIAEILLDAKFLEIQGCLVFFYQLLTEFVAGIETFSKMTDQAKAILIHSLRFGVGNFGENKSRIMNEFQFNPRMN